VCYQQEKVTKGKACATSRNEVLGHQATVPKLGANKGL
jgi:hypothetical protein